MLSDLRCPICAEPLTPGERAFTCPSGHSFDRARQGYVNLLRPTRLRGDTLEMLRARRRFLEAGWYAPLADALAEEVGAWLARDDAARIPPTARALLDVGCGEGYYLRRLAEIQAPALASAGWRLYGMDLSKDAIRMAAGLRTGMVIDKAADLAPGRTPEKPTTTSTTSTNWLVASGKDRLPFSDAGVGALLSVFAPRHPPEFARVVAPSGLLLVVTPTAEHLAEARAALPWLLTPEPAKDERLRATLEDAFTLDEARPVAFTLSLDAAALADLAAMTPHRPVEPEALAAATRAAVERSPDGRLVVRAECIVRRYRRRSA